MTAPNLLRVSALLTLALAAQLCHAEEKLTAKSFADQGEFLSLDAAALYIVYRDKIPLASILKPGEFDLQSVRGRIARLKAVAFKLDDLTDVLGTPPWNWKSLDEIAQPAPAAQDQPWKQISGITAPKAWNKNAVGPLRLRKTTDDLVKEVAEAKGATFGFSDNRLLHRKGVWNTEGVLFYPIKLKSDSGSGRSVKFTGGPAFAWKVTPAQEAGKEGIEEATYSVPLNFFISPGGTKMTGTHDENLAAAEGKIYSARWLVQAKPYLQTDFSGGHRIKGGEASAEFVGGAFHTQLYLGGFQNFPGSSLQYQIRVIPKIDYSDVDKIGSHSKRKLGDDWLRAGLTSSFDLRFGAATFTPLDVGISYSFLDELRGEDSHGHLFKASAVWWLSENAGLSLLYTRGDTPVADKPIDQLTLGFEFKY